MEKYHRLLIKILWSRLPNIICRQIVRASTLFCRVRGGERVPDRSVVANDSGQSTLFYFVPYSSFANLQQTAGFGFVACGLLQRLRNERLLQSLQCRNQGE